MKIDFAEAMRRFDGSDELILRSLSLLLYGALTVASRLERNIPSPAD